jgi:polyphosphate kinase
MIDVAYPYFDTNLSWLSNNYRLLLEAGDETVPGGERLRCLGLYAYQTKEFYRVRIPKLLAMREVSNDIRSKLNLYPQSLLEHVFETLDNQLREFEDLFTGQILPTLYEQGVHLYYQEEFSAEHTGFVERFFKDKLMKYLQPIFLDGRRNTKLQFFESKEMYLVVRLAYKNIEDEDNYAILNVPTAPFGRFIELSEQDGKKHVAFVEDLIKANFKTIFPGYEVLDCFAMRAERDTELQLEDEYSAPMALKILKQLEKRAFIQPLQFFYELGMPVMMREYLSGKMGIPMSEFYERGPYIQMQDLMEFPSLSKKLEYPVLKTIPKSDFIDEESIFSVLQRADQLLHLPYNSIKPIARFFNEAATDPFVKEIHVSLYKITPNSFMLNSIIAAARNGKKVITYVELNSKFDLQENVQWSKKMRDAGVKIIMSEPGLKVHAKIALVKRKVQTGWERYALLGTGSLYRLESREFVDHALLTCNREITNELELLFGFLYTQGEPKKFKYLPFNYIGVTQFNFQKKVIELIDREIANSNAGLKAFITIKLNQLQDHAFIDKLYQAGKAGVDVHVIVSQSCSLIPGLPTLSDNIIVSRHVDRFIENTRIFHFGNRGNEEIYLTSCDWTFRNLQRRIDLFFPILDVNIKNCMTQVMRNYVNDNQKSVRLDAYQNNLRLPDYVEPKLKAQEANYKLVERYERNILSRKLES